jgi:hypothetical protein
MKRKIIRKLTPRHARKAGLPPGTAVHVGEQKQKQVKITLIDYDADIYAEHETDDLDDLADAIQTPSITWINVAGLHDVALMQTIGEAFGIHPLLLEDILNTDQRHHLHPSYVCHQPVRNEFRVYARTGMALGLSGRVDAQCRHRSWSHLLFSE